MSLVLHLHFIGDDGQCGGHLLDLSARDLRLALHLKPDFHMAVPETEAFLAADLSGDPSAALAVAEGKRDAEPPRGDHEQYCDGAQVRVPFFNRSTR